MIYLAARWPRSAAAPEAHTKLSSFERRASRPKPQPVSLGSPLTPATSMDGRSRVHFLALCICACFLVSVWCSRVVFVCGVCACAPGVRVVCACGVYFKGRALTIYLSL